MTLVFTMTSRMIAIVGFCLVLFCAVLFLLGVQIGANYVHATPSNGAPAGTAVMPGAGALGPAGNPSIAPGSGVGAGDTSSSPSSGANQS